MPDANQAVTKILKIAIDALDELQAIEIKTLDVSSLTSLTDYMILCSGRSHRHVKAIADNLVRKLKSHAIREIRVTGLETANWILVDVVDLVVHVFIPEMRSYYDLEGLWGTPDLSQRHADQ